MSSTTSTDNNLFRQWLAAGLANAFTSGLLNPIDVAKTRMQTTMLTSTFRSTLISMANEGGIKGLFYPGLSASMIREMLSSGPRAGFYAPVRDFYLSLQALRFSNSTMRESTAKLLAALTTGIFGAILANPIDVVKIRLMKDPTSYSSTIGALGVIAKAEGLSGLYRGLLPSTLRGAFIAAGEIGTYDIAKSNLRTILNVKEESVAVHIGASLITGVVASVVAAPFDLIKARAMASTGSVETISSVLRRLAREPGFPLTLFRGVVPAYFRLGPHALICFPIYEQCRYIFGLGYL
jgi:hypothetical protein